MATPEEQQAINEAAARARAGNYTSPQGAVRMPEPRNIPGQVRQGFAMAGPQPPNPALVDSLVGRIAATPMPKDVPPAAVPSMNISPQIEGEYGVPPVAQTTKGIPASTSTEVTQQDTLNFTPYVSQNPTSMHDKDIEFTHTLSRMLGMAGLGDKAAGVRDLHMKLQMGRMDEVGEQAQRAFVAGDVTKGIDMFNHAVPNGQKIVGYHKGADNKTYAFKLEDGTEMRKTADELMQAITVFRNPSTLASMMTNRAKSLADMNKDMAVAGYKGQMSLAQAIAGKLMDRESQQALEKLKQAGEKPTVFQQIGGKTYVTAAGGRVFEEVTSTDKNGKMFKQWVPSQLPGLNTGGYAIDSSRIAAALGQ